jgi:hypothetical protein
MLKNSQSREAQVDFFTGNSSFKDGSYPLTRLGPSVSIGLYIAVAVASGLGLIGKVDLVRRILPLPQGLTVALMAVSFLLPLACLLALRARRFIALVALALIAVSSLVIFPRVHDMHSQGRGTDQPDCIVVASHAMFEAQWPYQRDKLWSHNPLSCGPGWVALQAPAVVTAGYHWNLIVIWAISLLAILYTQGLETTAGLLTLLALSPGFWLAACNGTDFLTFGIAFTALMASSQILGRRPLLFILISGLLTQFRIPTIILPALLSDRVRRRTALGAVLFAGLTQIVFIVWNVRSFIDDGPLHIIAKAAKSHVVSETPFIASLELLVPICCFSLLAVFVSRKVNALVLVSSFMTLIFCVPALLDLPRKYASNGSIKTALTFWEGGVWISALLPVASYVLIKCRSSQALRFYQRNSAVQSSHPEPRAEVLVSSSRLIPAIGIPPSAHTTSPR